MYYLRLDHPNAIFNTIGLLPELAMAADIGHWENDAFMQFIPDRRVVMRLASRGEKHLLADYLQQGS